VAVKPHCLGRYGKIRRSNVLLRFRGALGQCEITSVEIYKLTSGASELADRIEWNTRGRKSRPQKITDVQIFDERMLKIKTFGAEWDCKAFALSKGEIIRIYRTKKFAVIFRFLARSGTLLDHPIFKRLAKDNVFDPSSYERKAPAITEKRKTSKVSDDALSPEDSRELKQILQSAEKRLGITKSTNVIWRLELVEAEIEKVRRKGKLTEVIKTDLAIELGAELGQCFCNDLEWEWRRLKYRSTESMVCICCPERRLVICPGAWVLDLVSSKSPPLNCQLTFNLIEAGNLPPTRPGAYTPLN